MKNIISGSKNSDELTSNSSLDSLILELCTQEILSETFQPAYKLNISKSQMYMCPSTFTFSVLNPDSEIVLLEKHLPEDGDVLVMSGFKTLIVPVEDIIPVGWN